MAAAKAYVRPAGRPRHGSERPRLAPPLPARSHYKDLVEVAEEIGIHLMPWQITAARYTEAIGPDGRWLYPEVAHVVSRQNGKTEELVAFILRRLRMGRRIMHTAQNRELPREVFGRVADIAVRERGFLARTPRFANGQEEMITVNGGKYRIVAPTRGGARGPSNDDLVIDEVREMDSHDFIAAARPTLMASPNPQILYLSNMGDDTSVVLNSLRARREEDPSLAYLEWSAAPEREASDREGWYEANPAIGHMPRLYENLERDFASHVLAGTLSIFETENLCRAVVSMRERLVDAFAWHRCESPDDLGAVRHPVLGVAVDPSGTRASVAAAWQMGDLIGLRLLFDVKGSPIDLDLLGSDVRAMQAKVGAPKVGFDPLTDAGLAKHLRNAEAVNGTKYANATAQFVNAIEGTRLRWQDVDAVTDDLTFTARKQNAERGSFEAVRARDDRPITAVLAAIRAVWLASGPRPPVPKVYAR